MKNDNNEYCRICENCGLPIKDLFITRCPRCNSVLQPVNLTCNSCKSRSTCAMMINFDKENKKEK